MPLSKTGADFLFELISQRYERGSTLITSNFKASEFVQTAEQQVAAPCLPTT